MTKIRGVEEHVRHVRRLMPEIKRNIGPVLFAEGHALQVAAQHSITEGAISGAGHVPSDPGQPPKADTHSLDRQIETVQLSQTKVEVSSNARTSAWLEFGTSRMAARPFMGPAAAQRRPHIIEAVHGVVVRVIRGKEG